MTGDSSTVRDGGLDGAVEGFCWVRDRPESSMDVRGLYSGGFDDRQKHNGKWEEGIARHDQGNGFALETLSRGDSIPRYTPDVLWAVYDLRTQGFEVGRRDGFSVSLE